MLHLLKFSANWCGPCKVMKPAWEAVKLKFPDVIFEEVDIENDQLSLSNKYNVSSIPTIIFLKNGVETLRVVGSRTDLALLISNNK